MKLIRSYKHIDSIFIQGSIIFFVIMLLNFALSSSPYSSLHSGKVGYYGTDATFYFNTAYSMIGCFVFLCILKKFFRIDGITAAFCLFILISLFFNFSPDVINSYLYDIISIMLVSAMASYDTKASKFTGYNEKNDKLSLFAKFISLFILIGFILVILFPGRYGLLSSSMSRDERGEVTLWVMLCLPILALSCQLVNLLRKKTSTLQLAIALFACFITCMTASRTAFLVYGVSICLFCSLKVKNKIILYLTILIALIFVITSNNVKELFLLGNTSITSDNVSDILNGRYDLWLFYIDTFINNIAFGAGPNALTEDVAAFLGATSEVGILKTAASYGIIPTLIEIYLIIQSFRALKKIYDSPNSFSHYDIFIAFLFLSSIILIIQQHARIQNYGNLICWYSMFYMYNLNKKSKWN